MFQVLVAGTALHKGTFSNGKAISADPLLHAAHGSQNGCTGFLWRKRGQSFRRGKFQIDTHAVSQIAHLFQQIIRSIGDGFDMDVAVEMVAGAQQKQCLIHQFHCVCRILIHTGTQKQAFDIVASVKFDYQLTDLIRGKCGTSAVVVGAALAVATVIDTVVTQQDLQQGDTSAVPGKTVADAGGTGIAKRALFSAAVYTAGSTGYIVFCRIG